MRKYPSPLSLQLLQLGDRNFHFFLEPSMLKTHQKTYTVPVAEAPGPWKQGELQPVCGNLQDSMLRMKNSDIDKQMKNTVPLTPFFFHNVLSLRSFGFLIFTYLFHFLLPSPRLSIWWKDGTKPHSSLSSLQVHDRNLWTGLLHGIEVTLHIWFWASL